MRFTALALFLALFPIPAWAASWLEVTSSVTGTIVYVDNDSISNDTKFGKYTDISAWLREDYAQDKTEKAREAKKLMRYDCEKRESYLISYVSFRANGTVLENIIIPRWRASSDPVVPDSVGEAELDFVCLLAGYVKK